MQTTTNYGLKIYEGTDLFNPLTVENVNTSDLDTIVKGVSNAAVGTATELLTGTVHALTRSDTARNVFHFTATANFEAGETFEVDGVQVTAKTPDGQNLSTGAYVINSSVLCILDGTLLTVIVNPAKALDSDKLNGHDSTYFATAGDLSTLDNQVGAISTKVGTGVLDVGSNCVDGINTLNTHLSDMGASEFPSDGVDIRNYTSANPYEAPSDGFMYLGVGAGTNGLAWVKGSNAGSGVCAMGGTQGFWSCYVRKGMLVYGSASPTTLKFFALGNNQP